MKDFEQEKTLANRQELAARIASGIREDGTIEHCEGLFFNRSVRTTEGVHGVSKPSLCIVAQGAKVVTLGESHYRYDQERYLLATVELPVTGKIIEACEDRPYLSLRLDLDPAVVGSVMVEAGLPAPRSQTDAKAVVTSPLDAGLLDAVVRLIRVVDTPDEVRVLAPLIKREIVFRLLIGEQGGRLRHLAMQGSHARSITQAVEMLRKEFARPLRIDGIAKDLGMSSSGFHHHFKAITEMSPLQFQKQLRLQEARRLMLGENLDAADAGFRVGYDDASHFSRDYKKRFGDAPGRDVENLRSALVQPVE